MCSKNAHAWPSASWSAHWSTRMYGFSTDFLLTNTSRITPMTTLPKTARGIIPAASTMPAAMDQNRKARSSGSFTAVRKRTMDSAPTMPRESTTLLVTARITMAVIMVIATRVTPKLEEYITPEKVFLYTRKMNSPMPKASTRDSAMSSRLTLFTLSRKLDLKIS